MKTYMKAALAAGLSAIVAVGSIVPAQAMPIVPAAPVAPQADNNIVNVQYWRDRGYYRDYGPGYYRGHRGYRDYRPGYRRHNGYWFPLAAFAAGALIGGAVAAQPRYVDPGPRYVAPARSGINPRHYEYCAARYRSYDSYTNTFQPNHGPRQQCYSPFY